MNPFPQVDRVTKHTVTLPFGVFEALRSPFSDIPGSGVGYEFVETQEWCRLFV